MELKRNILAIIFFIFSLNSFSLEVGESAPEFSMNDLEGKSVSLSSLKGKIVLVDFWASWCGPCRQANPIIAETYLKFQPLGFEIISISLDENKDSWTKAIEQDQIPWKLHLSDLKGWASEVVSKYGVEALPTAFLLDRDGKIISKDPMPDDLELELHDLFLNEITFYPKSVDDKIFLSTISKYKILDSNGKKLLKGEGDEIQVSWLKAGEYTIEYGEKNGIFKKRDPITNLISFYPKNVTSKITLSKSCQYEVHSLKGDLLKDGNGDIVELKDLDTGVYYLVINGHTEKFYKK